MIDIEIEGYQQTYECIKKERHNLPNIGDYEHCAN